MSIRILSSIIWFLCIFSNAYSQSENKVAYPVLGQTVPDFTLNKISYYSKKQASSKDFKGKWLILDFWSRGCASCVESWPKMNKLQEEFKDSVQLILVGVNSGYWGGKEMEKVYESFKKKYRFNMAIVYDSLIAKVWGIVTVPHIVVVDPQGVVRAVTSSVDKENLNTLLTSKETTLRNKKNAFERLEAKDPVDIYKPFYLNGNVGKDIDFRYRSVLSKFDASVAGMTRAIVPYLDEFFKKKLFIDDMAYWQGTGLDITQLYKLAYTGQIDLYMDNPWEKTDSLYFTFFNKLILEVSDSTLFRNPEYKEKTNGFYNYSLMMPKEKTTLESMKLQVQCDLKKYFGFDVAIETRMMPYYKLTATEDAKKKLRSKGGHRVMKTDGYTGIKYVNAPVEWVLLFLADDTHSFRNETGIEGNIDLNLDVMLEDKEAIKRVLKKNGLEVIKGYREMKCIVIRDAK